MGLKAKILFGLLLMSIFSCGFSETKKLDNSLRKTIDENNCQLELKSMEKNDTKQLKLKLLSRNDSAFFYGKVLYDFINYSKKEQLKFNNYSICTYQDQEILFLSEKDFEIVSRKKSLFDKHIKMLCKNDLNGFVMKMDTSILNHIDTIDFKQSIIKNNLSNKTKFNGFKIDGKTYISFSTINENNKNIIISYLYDDDSDNILGFSIK